MGAVEEIYQDGYRYVRVSRGWAKLCSVLPCFDRIRWPDYAATAIDTVIDGVPVVIQLWKGWCPRFLGSAHMPGGVGAEVGVYRQSARPDSDAGSAPVERPHPRRAPPAAKRARHQPLSTVRHVVSGASHAAKTTTHREKTAASKPASKAVSNERLWWPAPELHANLQFELLWRGKTFFKTDPLHDTYWLTQWMDVRDYDRYKQQHDTPTYCWDFTQRYWINGKLQPDWVGHAPAPRVKYHII